MEVDTIAQGQRGAINLASIEKDQIQRGDMLVDIGKIIPSRRIMAKIKMVRETDYILKNRGRVRFHIGTLEVIGRVIILDSDILKANEDGLVVFILEKPIFCIRRDRFIIRTYSPMQTIAGGIIVEPHAGKIRRHDPTISEKAKIYLGEDDLAIANFHIKEKGYILTHERDLLRLFNHDEVITAKVMKSLDQLPDIARFAGKDGVYYIEKGILKSVEGEILEHLSRYHRENPLKPGLQKADLFGKFRNKLTDTALDLLIQKLSKEGRLTISNQYISQSGFVQKLTESDHEKQRKIERMFLDDPTNAPDLKQLTSELKVDGKVLEYLINTGILVKIGSGIIFHQKIIEEIEKKVKAHFAKEEYLDIQSFKRLFNASRKYIIPLLEYFDQRGLTKREKDRRVLKVR